MTLTECKSWLFKLGVKHGVSPKSISERLLSKADKEDMLNGLISFETINCAVGLWKNDNMRHYADGTLSENAEYALNSLKGRLG